MAIWYFRIYPQQPNREFVILGGATPTRCFGRMRIKDTKLRIEADQVTVGTISAVPNASVIPQRKGLLYDRFEFGHVDDVVSANGFLTLRLESGPKNTIQVTRVGKEEQRDDVPKVLLGPVVGWVDAWCAVILLEIDRDADIVCFVENPLTRETRRVFQRFRTHQANSFCITHLRSEHYYRVSFENVQHSERFHASFTMLAKSPTHFDVIALCNDNKPLCISDMLHKDSKGSSLWHAIAEHSMEVPFVALNLTLQLGGQFHVESNAHVHEALTHADEMRTSVTPSKERKDRTRAAILHCFGAMYRETWNTPGIRQSLAHGAHVLLTNDNDQLPVTHQDAEDPHHVNVRTLLAKVHEKYQNLLLPPSKRLREDERRWEKPLHHCFGAFGLFVLPLQELEGSCVHELTWQSLRGLLATPTLSDLLLVTTAPLIEESFEDIQAKTSMDAACRSKFGAYPNDVALLLELLFDWQRGTTSAQRNKQVVLLSGSKCQSLDSVIRQVYKTQERMQTTTGFPNLPTADVHELFQCVVGPVQSASNAGPCPSAFFTQGTLLGRYTFHHSPVRKSLPVSSTGTATSQKATHEGVHDCPMSTQVLVHLQLAIGNNEHRDTLKCTFVSHQVIQVDKALDKDVADERVMLKIQTRCCQVDTWQLSTAIPSWLQEFVVPSTTGKEDEQMRHRLEYLRTREHEIRTTFYETFCLANGLVTLSRGKQCVNALTTSFKRAHELGGSGWQEKFPLPPSQFIVAFTLQQLQTSKSLVQQLAAVGAMELDEYALVFEQSFMNAWLFNERL